MGKPGGMLQGLLWGLKKKTKQAQRARNKRKKDRALQKKKRQAIEESRAMARAYAPKY